MADIFGPSTRELLGYILAGLATIFWGATAMVRRYSRDRVERAKDRDEIDSTKIAREDANRLREEVRSLRSELTEAYRQSNSHLREVGVVTAKLDVQIEITRVQTETIRAFSHELERASVVSLKAIEAVGVKADAAYREANTVNKKIEQVGMKMADDKPLDDRAAKG